jgi:nitrite reductase/ring-hydroxylating ferredoxin subunit
MRTTDDHRAERYAGYFKRKQLMALAPDSELLKVGPGTAGGEYLRRFWHPIALTRATGATPRLVRVLGEDLVLYRDANGAFGLLERHCSHRGTSLEFARVTERGLVCCYHGWTYAIDGTIVETPGEPAESPIKRRLAHPAYPVREWGGLLFAYLGPPAEMPPLPIYDAMAVPGNETVPYILHWPCNWLQAHENGMDPVHSVFLHTRASGTQFEDVFGALPVLSFERTATGMTGMSARRWGDNIWIRHADSIMPNCCQFGAFWETGREEKYFRPAALTRWLTPVDDSHSISIGFRHFNDAVDPARTHRDRAQIGTDRVDFPGQTAERPFAERQIEPGDYDAQVYQGPIAIHDRENLGSTDAGIAMLRHLLRTGIESIARGERIVHPAAGADGIVPTYNHDTVIRRPLGNATDDRARLKEIGEQIGAIVRASAGEPRERRAAYVERRIRTEV